MGSIIYSVEDDVDIARIINKTLTKQGYQVYSFQDGKSFIEAFNKQKPDLVLPAPKSPSKVITAPLNKFLVIAKAIF